MTSLAALLTLFAALLSEETQRPARRSAAGILVTDGSRVLLLLRSEEVTEPRTWGVPGGSAELGETPLRAALREVVEEIGGLPSPGIFVGQKKVGSFTTFVWLVDPSVLDAFRPRLNWEHDAALLKTVPEALLLPLHPGLRTLLEGAVPGLGSPIFSSGLITAVYDYYREPGVRELHHAFKDLDLDAVERVCSELAPYVPRGAVLVPMPDRTGRPRSTLDLVRCLSEQTGRPFSSCLVGDQRPSLYEAKKRGEIPELGFRVEGPVPAGRIVVVDHVIGTGATARAALAAFPQGRAQVLAHAIDLQSFRP